MEAMSKGKEMGEKSILIIYLCQILKLKLSGLGWPSSPRDWDLDLEEKGAHVSVSCVEEFTESFEHYL